MAQIEVLVAAPGEIAATPFSGPADALDRELNGQLSELAGSGEIRGNRDSATIVHASAQGTKRVAVAGLGKPDELTADSLRTAAAAVARKATFGGTIAWVLDDTLPLDLSEQTRATLDGIVIGSYD